MDAQEQLKRGTFWLGSASVVARLVDVGATLAVVSLLTQEQIGLAALALSTCAILESLSGIGIGGALIQATTVSRAEESSLFWLTSAIGLALGLIVVALAPFLAAIYGQPELLPLIAASGLKLLFVGMGLVPLQLLSKRLMFKEQGAVQTLASLGEGATKIVLALGGAGAWAMVLGNVMRGGALLLSLWLLSAFRPQLHFAFRETRRFLRFGLHLAGSSVLYQVYKNADYFLVGKVLGIEALGLYRVAFDLAMQPTDAIIAVVGRVAFPIYSRLVGDLQALRAGFVANTRSLFLMVVPIAVCVFYAADDVLSLLGDGRWTGSVAAVQILVWAGLLRAATVAFSQVYVAMGRPQYATLDSALTLVLLTAAFGLGLWGFPELGVLSVCYAWLVAYPLLLGWHLFVSRRLVALAPLEYLRAVASGLAPALPIALALSLVTELTARTDLGWGAVVVFAATTIVVHSGYLRWVLKVRWRELVPKRPPRSAPLTGSK
jgi:O-antigen/teichoic acid export membrane protein